MKTIKTIILPLLVLSFFFSACNKDEDKPPVNIFSVNDDIELGIQVQQEIEADPINYPILDPSVYTAAYGFVNDIMDEIMNSGEVYYKDDFDWRIRIIHNDSVLNAFCAPGGFICIYTGILKFLDQKDHFAGVLGHEIAHADRRHVTSQLTKAYGLSVLLSVVLGDDENALKDIAGGLVSLSFSRSHETDADEWSVKYLCPTSMDARGAAGFFQKLIDLGASSGTPQFLSTHPNPDNRVEHINETFDTECGTAGGTFDAEYAAFKMTLP